MRSDQPPHLATWLLERLVSGPTRESLIGDLEEKYRCGRSSVWYWRQTIMAVLLSSARDIRDHRLVAVRAAVITWMFLIPWVFFTGWAYGSTRFWVSATLKGSVAFQDFWIIYQVPLLISWCLGSALIGWIVARLDADCRAGMLLVCAMSQLPFSLQWGGGWALWRIANVGLPFFATFPVIVQAASVIVLMPLSLWLGGLTAMEPRRHPFDYGTRTTGARQNATF
jgi:hypothetical protein